MMTPNNLKKKKNSTSILPLPESCDFFGESGCKTVLGILWL